VEVFKLTVICPKCKTIWQGDVLPETTLKECRKCDATVFKVSRYKGYIYVMSTKSLRGSVKVGRTWSVPQRRRGLSTPVPENYVTLAYFGSSNPAKDEARVKKKLAKHNLAKEHYRLEPSLAVAEIRTALSYRDPLYVLPRLRPKYEATLEERRMLPWKIPSAKRQRRGARRPETAVRARRPPALELARSVRA
jgi:T5orf172 domain